MSYKRNGNHSTQQESEKQSFQIFVVLTACLAGATTGMIFVWTSPSIPKIVEDKINYDITLDEASYFVVLPSIGSIVACLMFANTIDIFGRKYSVLLTMVPYIIAWILTAIAKEVYVFYIARFISGMGNGFIFISVPTYIAEVSTPRIRGIWGNALVFFQMFGQLLINIIGSYLDIRTTAYISLSLPIFFICIFIFMPETPYFYLMKNRDDDAKKVLQKLRQKTDVDVELKKLKADVHRQISESGTWKDLFFIESNRKALYAGFFLRFSQQFGGFSSVSFYTQYIFLKSGSNISASISSIIVMSLCLILNPVASYNLEKVGRKKAYFYSILTCGITLLLEAIYFYIDQNHPEIDLTGVNWIPLVGMIIFIIFYTFGQGIIPTLMTGELFSASVKGKGICMLSIAFSVAMSLVAQIFHLLDTNFGLYAPFLLFSISDFVCTALTLYLVPETKGKTLEEIQQDLKRKR